MVLQIQEIPGLSLAGHQLIHLGSAKELRDMLCDHPLQRHPWSLPPPCFLPSLLRDQDPSHA